MFQDHRPAAPHHYLVVPKEHIRDAKALTKSHIALGELACGVKKVWETSAFNRLKTGRLQSLTTGNAEFQ